MIIKGSSLFTMSLALVAAAVLGLPAAHKGQSRTRLQTAVGGTCLAARMRGNDVGAKINACDTQLGSSKGEILLSGGGTISTPVNISSNHTLRVSSGIYSATNDGAVIRLKDDSALICDSWDAVLQESTGKNDRAGVKPFTIAAAYNGTTLESPNGTIAQNLVIKGCHFKGARSDFDSASQAISLGNCHNCSVTNNWLEATRTMGIQTGGRAVAGKYAENVTIAKNLLTNVASQNIAIVNSSNVQVTDNIIKAPGSAGGPGVVPIDIEPNVGDRIVNVKITKNLIDMTHTPIDRSAKALHGIAINNLNGANPFAGIEVTQNTIYGGDFKDPNNHVSGGLILARAAQNTVISNNILRRGTYCILIDSGSSKITVTGNQLSSCGSGSSVPFRIQDSSDNEIYDNTVWADPSNTFDLSRVARAIVEAGSSNNNVFRGNNADVLITGRNSRKM
jgi:parallel beta-helix repeat protein